MSKAATSGRAAPTGSSRPGAFQPGNRAAAAARGSKHNTRFITQNLISQLNEVIASPEAKTPDEKRAKAETIYWINKRLIKNALDGDNVAIKMIMDRVEGTPVQSVQLVDNTPDAEAARLSKTAEHFNSLPEDEQAKLYQAAVLATQQPHGSA